MEGDKVNINDIKDEIDVNQSEIAQGLLDLIEIVLNNSNSNTIKSIHRQGYITQVLVDNTYKVMIDEKEYTISAREGLILALNDIVIIMLFNGDINRPWIIDKKTWKSW